MQILPVKLMEAKEKYETFFVHLVTLQLRSSTLHFAVCDQDINFAGINFIAFPVSIGAIKSTVDSKMDNVDITISDCTNAFKVALLKGEDFRGCVMDVTRVSYPESLTDTTLFQLVFRGELDSPSLDDGKSEFKCTARQLMSNYETGRTLMFGCNNQFGDEDCGVTKETVTGTIQAWHFLNKIQVEQTYPDNHWRHGYITINGQSIAIIDSEYTTVTTEFPFAAMYSGAYTLTSGCNMGWDYCKSRYNNRKNYSGCPAIPWENSIKT